MSETKQFPEGMTPLAGAPFTFRCHPGVSCFTVCCKNVDLDLYPYDIIRLKNNLSIDSEQFVRTHTELAKGANPYFPTLKLKLEQKAGVACCPFLDETGCLVYRDRPTACRTYPLERAVDRSAARGQVDDYYFLVKHDYCKGHYEDQEMNVKRWIRNQQLDTFNLMNEGWTEIDTLFATNPWKGEGSGGPKQQLAFMVCYDIDGFRSFAAKQRLVEQYQLKRELRKKLERDDEELLKFGFEWLKDIFGGRSALLRR
jgi:hypothetical protein